MDAEGDVGGLRYHLFCSSAARARDRTSRHYSSYPFPSRRLFRKKTERGIAGGRVAISWVRCGITKKRERTRERKVNDELKSRAFLCTRATCRLRNPQPSLDAMENIAVLSGAGEMSGKIMRVSRPMRDDRCKLLIRSDYFSVFYFSARHNARICTLLLPRIRFVAARNKTIISLLRDVRITRQRRCSPDKENHSAKG